MIPVLYESTETSFSAMGLGLLKDSVSCYVTEELNGEYELEMEYPIDGYNYDNLQKERIIFAQPEQGKLPQPFQIYKITKPFDGIVTVYAEHISYRLSRIPVSPFTAGSVSEALSGLLLNSEEDNPFEVWTDKSTIADYNQVVPRSFRNCLGGVDGSILDTYGGEYEFDNFTVRLWNRRGSDKGVKILYGKNLVDATQEEAIDSVVTGIYPYWKGTEQVTENETTYSEEVVVMLPEKIIESEYVGNYAHPRTEVLDMTSYFQTQPTVEELRSAAESYVKNNLTGVPNVSITVKYQNLADTVEYRNLSSETVNLGDTVVVFFQKLGIDATARISKCVWDVLYERYDSLTVGSVKSNMATTVSSIKATADSAITQSTLMAALTLQQQLITGGSGGYVVTRYVNGHPSELVFGDTDDITTMQKCLRVNNLGIGFSQTGFNGPYTTAWTIDGSFNASFITTGTLNATLIRAGILQDVYNGKYFTANLETGYIRINYYDEELSTLKAKFVVEDASAKMTDESGQNYTQITTDGVNITAGGVTKVRVTADKTETENLHAVEQIALDSGTPDNRVQEWALRLGETDSEGRHSVALTYVGGN